MKLPMPVRSSPLKLKVLVVPVEKSPENPAMSENGVYALTLATANGWTQDYTVTATPVAGGGTNGVDQTSDSDCTSFSLTSAGAKSATGNQPTSCW